MTKKTKLKGSKKNKSVQNANKFFLQLKKILEDFEVEDFEPYSNGSLWDGRIEVTFVGDKKKDDDGQVDMPPVSYHFSTHREWGDTAVEDQGSDKVTCADSGSQKSKSRPTTHKMTIHQVIKEPLINVVKRSSA